MNEQTTLNLGSHTDPSSRNADTDSDWFIDGSCLKYDEYNMAGLKRHQDQLAHLILDGSECPCCGQDARAYSVPVDRSMASALVWMVGKSYGIPQDALKALVERSDGWKRYDSEYMATGCLGTEEGDDSESLPSHGRPKRWIEMPKEAPLWLQRSRRYTKLAYWGLIEPRTNITYDGPAKQSGIWRPTPIGYNFMVGIESITQYAITYNKEVVAFRGKQVVIKDALGKSFDFQLMMAGKL